MNRWTLAGFVLGFLLGLALVTSAHGLVAVPPAPGVQVCACSSAIRADGTVDVCATGAQYYSAPSSDPAPLEPKLVSLTRIRRLAESLRWQLAEPPP